MDKVIILGNLFGKVSNFAGTVYDTEGLAPTLNTMEGGLRQPMIIEVNNECEETRNNES